MTTIEFNKQYQPLEDLLFAFAMKLTKNVTNAQDLMQETLYRAFKNRDRFLMGSNFKAWITTIMRNNFINVYRKNRTRNKVEAPIEDFNYFIESKTVEGNADSMIMMKELRDLIESLPSGFKKSFNMYNEGFHYDEIAEIMSIPIGTVKSRIFFARKKLRKMVATQYGTTLLRRA